MKIIKGNLFEYDEVENSAICITTNAFCKKDGSAVMGAGVAAIAKTMYPGCEQVLGALMKKKGSIVQNFWKEPNLIAFPTKKHWQEESILELIENSCHQLVDLQKKKKYDYIFLPRVGVGMGKLLWQDVKPLISKILTEDLYVIVDNSQ